MGGTTRNLARGGVPGAPEAPWKPGTPILGSPAPPQVCYAVYETDGH